MQQLLDAIYLVVQSWLSHLTGPRGLAVAACLLGAAILLGWTLNLLLKKQHKPEELRPPSAPTPKAMPAHADDLESVRYFVLLSEMVQRVTAAHRLEEVSRVTLEQARKLFPFFAEFALFNLDLSNPSEPALVLQDALGLDRETGVGYRIPWNRGLIGRCCEQQMSLDRRDLEQRFGRQAAGEDREMNLYSPQWAVPLTDGMHCFACLTLNRVGGSQASTALDVRVLAILRDVAGLALRHAQKFESLDENNKALSTQADQVAQSNQSLQMQVRDQVRALREKDRQLVQTEQLALFGEFVATLTHDIKNPLAFIAGEAQWAAELLQDHKLDHEGLAKSIDVIRKNAARLQEDLQNLLGQLQIPHLSFESIALRPFLQEIYELSRRHAESRGLKLELKQPEGPVHFDGHAGLLRNALLNLIGNSLSLMKPGGILTLEARGDDKTLFLDVMDTGPGIDPEEVPKIFELFYSKRPGGTGLGLHSVRRVIERQHHGRIRVKSQLGKGTEFMIEVPLKQERKG